MNYASIDTESTYVTVQPEDTFEVTASTYRSPFSSADLTVDLTIGPVYFDELTLKEAKLIRKELKRAINEAEGK